MNWSNVSFFPLTESDFSQIHQWFNKPHVQAFYSLKNWTLEEVREKLASDVLKKKLIQSFIIYLDEIPIGYIQSYPIKNHPWENQDLPEEVVDQAAGIDLFIGEEKMLQKGLGFRIIDSYLERYIWPSYRYCLADPDIRNELSISLFEKVGFKKHKIIGTTDALSRPVSLQLFIKEHTV